jgi:hypothetical protein
MPSTLASAGVDRDPHRTADKVARQSSPHPDVTDLCEARGSPDDDLIEQQQRLGAEARHHGEQLLDLGLPEHA